jgi:hypothetical protein
VRATSFREWEVGRFNINLVIMIPDFILVPITADMVRNIRPGPEAVNLGAFQEKEFFVGAPFWVEYWERVLLDDSVRMGGWLMRIARRAIGEALHAEIVLVAGAVGASYPDLLETR